MQTSFPLAQLADPDIAEANAILRACVHCGFCTATCPTYTLLGDELDSPRGRIYQIKDMKMVPLFKSRSKEENEMRYVDLFKQMKISEGFYFSYTYDLTHTLQYNMLR